ncbi:hypothetical protein HX794_00725 [Pseudomonas costantinii]|nr:hypothetical protein [Pseudomonas costantinii]OIN43979.1 hypothetical protein BFL40_30810 [Pseudomonas costantinii]
MLGMARGQNDLDQGGAQGAEPQGKQEPDLIKKLMEMLSGAAGAQGGGGSAGSDCSECQKSPEELEQLAAGRQGMEAMMPGNDNGRQINA